VPYTVVRPVQHEQEGHDANGHALASNFAGGDQAYLHLQVSQVRIFKEGFPQGQKEEEKTWY
jgi:hypothetical protein